MDEMDEMDEMPVTRRELNVLLDLLVPMPDPKAMDGPSQLARSRREWIDRKLENIRYIQR